MGPGGNHRHYYNSVRNHHHHHHHHHHHRHHDDYVGDSGHDDDDHDGFDAFGNDDGSDKVDGNCDDDDDDDDDDGDAMLMMMVMMMVVMIETETETETETDTSHNPFTHELEDRLRMICGARTIAAAYPDASTRREDIKHDWAIVSLLGERFLPCELDAEGFLIPDALKYARHDGNKDREYVSLEESYCDRLLKEGYDDELAGSISLVASDAHNKSWFSIGGGNRKGAVVRAAKKDRDNDHLKAFIRTGGFSAVWYRHDTPLLVITWLIDTLNSKNGLGASTTVMQKVSNVSKLLTEYQMYLKDCEDNGLEGDDLWEFVKKSTSIYESEVTWKKAVALNSIFKSNVIGNVTVLDSVTQYFAANVDVLACQNQEKQRNLLKFIADLAAKIMPVRKLEQRGLCRRYPELFVEVVRRNETSKSETQPIFSTMIMVMFGGHVRTNVYLQACNLYIALGSFIGIWAGTGTRPPPAPTFLWTVILLEYGGGDAPPTPTSTHRSDDDDDDNDGDDDDDDGDVVEMMHQWLP